MSFNLCSLPKEEQEKVEVEKAAAYAVWKERNPRSSCPPRARLGTTRGRCRPSSCSRSSGTGRSSKHKDEVGT